VSVAAGSDGRIYALGGQSGATTLASAEAYTIATDTWTQVASLPEPRAATQAVLAPDGRIYVPGGADLGDGIIYASVAAYRAGAAPRADRWAEVAPLAQPRQRHGVALGSDGRVYVFSGSNLLGFVRTTEAYGPLIASSAAHAAPAATIQVTGSNFATNAAVRVTLGSPTGPTVATGVTDATGKLASTTVTIPPAASAGPTSLYVIDARSRYPATTPFTVD
jgi:hypothetical protein